MKNNKDNDIIMIDLREMLYMLLHRIWIIIIVAVIGAIGSGLASIYLIKPLYTSATMVYLINREDDNRTTYNDLQMGSQLTKDYSILVRGRVVLEQVIDLLDIDIGYEGLRDMVKVSTPEGTRVLEINASYDDPELARLLADTITEISSHRMIEIMNMKEVNVLEPANLPTRPSSPNIIQNIILGGFIGIVLTSLILIVPYILNDNIKNSEDVENRLGLTVLGIIYLEESKRKRRRVRAKDIKNQIRYADLEDEIYYLVD